MSTWVNLLEVLYPVGSLYLSTVNVSPAEKIGGTWTQITDATLRGAATSGYIGSDTHTITTSEMPAHTHSASTASGGNHRHELYVKGDASGGTTAQRVFPSAEGGGEWKWSSAVQNTGAHSHTITIGNTGSGSAMSILQRSYNCFVWERTA